MFKVYISYPFKNTPWGGGNQFLKLLKKELQQSGRYTENIRNADVIILNSHHVTLQSIFSIIKLMWKRNIVILHRIDGPISHIRDSSRRVDDFIYQINALFSNVTVFQSNWSRDKNYDLGIDKRNSDTVIYNASDPSIFNNNFKKNLRRKKTRLITTSWSTNEKKGRDIFEFLDANLDFVQYEYIFVGNYNGEFKNIKHIPPVLSKDLYKYLVDSDVFIAASKDDPCSNSVIEAMTTGLPIVALNSGGHPELIGLGGELYNDYSDVLTAIDKVSGSIEKYQKSINVMSSKEVSDAYYKQAVKFKPDDLIGKFKLVWMLFKYCHYSLIYKFRVFSSRTVGKIKRTFF